MNYLNIIKKHFMLTVVIVVFSVAVTAFLSFTSPKIYRSNAVIMPSASSNDYGGMSTIASQFGIPSSKGSNVSEIVSLLKSNILMERVIKKYDLLPVLFSKTSKGKKDSKSIWDGIRLLRNNVYKVRNNIKEGVIELSVEYHEPEVSARILTYILKELTDYMSSEAKRVAETNRVYLESLIEKNADPLIKQKIYSLIAKQIEMSMMAEVKENFAFKVLDPPKVPDRKIRPAIRSNILLSLFISLIAGLFLSFAIEYIKIILNNEKCSS